MLGSYGGLAATPHLDTRRVACGGAVQTIRSFANDENRYRYWKNLVDRNKLLLYCKRLKNYFDMRMGYK
jgi:negative regulator of sigma E activity